MTKDSLPAPARTTQGDPPTPDLIAEAVENVLARLRDARPHLESRLDRAATIVVVHLSSAARTRPIRCRIRKNGKRVYLVASLSAGGAVYEVNPTDYSCSCPDYHRRGAACKHGIAAWIVANAAAPRHHERPSEIPCEGCGELLPRDRLIEAQEGEAEATLNPGMRVCRMCAKDHGLPIPRSSHEASEEAAQDDENGDDEPEASMPESDPADGLTHAQVERWLEERRWIFARSRPTNPHAYCLRRECEDEDLFERVVEHIREFGQPYPWWGTVYLQYVAWGFAYWTMGARPQETVLINRKPLEQVRLDQLTNKGGGGIVWPWLHNDVEAEREELRQKESGQDELTGGGA